MEPVRLLLVPNDCNADEIFESLGEAAGAFSDNGGDPDGRGPYMASAEFFTPEEIKRAQSRGARLAWGWRVPYGGSIEDPDSLPRGPWCGYSGEGVAYTTSMRVAKALVQHEISRRIAEEED